MKKICRQVMSLFLAAALVIGMVPAAFAAGADSSMALTVSSVSGTPGSEVTVKLNIANNPGVAALNLDVSYDSILTLQEVAVNDEMGGSTTLSPTSNNPLTLLWYRYDADYTAESFTFATLTFLISEDAEEGASAAVSVSYDPENIYNKDEENIHMTVTDGSVGVLSCIPGDINGDETVNMKDLTRLAQYLAKWDVSVNEAVTDTNGDGAVNMKDLTRLAQYLAHWNVTLYPLVAQCDHTMEAMAYQAPTCTEDGHIAYWHCTTCDKYFSNEAGTAKIDPSTTVIKASHTLEYVPYQAPTTETAGNIEYWYCSICSKCFLDAEGVNEVEKDKTVLSVVEEGKTFVQYDLYGGDTYLTALGVENPNPSEFVSESGLSLSPLDAPAGYTFKGWRIVDGTAEGTPVTKLDAQSPGTTVRLRAVWELIEYSITYKNYMTPVGEVVSEDYLSYYVNQGKPNLPNPEVKNYVFLGWYDENGQEVTSIPAGTTGNIVLDGYWTSLRNMAKAQKLGTPIILEDNDEGIIYFAYELGTIENIPVSDAIWSLQSVAGLEQQVSKTVTTSISSTQAQSIAETISNETVDSGTWTLSEEWNNSTQVNETWAEEHGMTVEEAEEQVKTSSGTYSVTDSTGGSKFTDTTDGTTTKTYTSKDHSIGESTGLDTTNGEIDSQTGTTDINVTIGNNYTPSKVEVGAGVSVTDESNWSETNSQIDTEETAEHSGTDTTAVHTTVGNTASSWNKSSTASSTQSASVSSSSQKAMSQMISTEKGYGKTYSYGGSGSQAQGFSSSASTSTNSSSSLSYSTGETTTTTTTYSSDGRLEGKYRLVIAGTAHVYGIVGYDIASKSYFTYTFSVMDDKTYEFLDYTPKGYNFDDYEYSVLPFEIPDDIHDYVNEQTAKTDGLEFRTNSSDGTATVTKYTGDSTDVMVPSYISSGGTMYKVTSISASAFAGKPVRAVALSKFIDSIPAGAFKDCTALEQVSGRFTEIGNEAFSGCTSLENFNLSKNVTAIGTNAFAGAGKVTVYALGEDAALALAKEQNPEANEETLKTEAGKLTQELVNAAVQSGAKELTLDLSTAMDGVALTLDVPDTMSRFEVLGGGKTYADLKLTSRASETVLREMTIENYAAIPLEIYSSSVTLEVVTVKSANFAMTLAADVPTVTLRRDSRLNSAKGNALVCKNPAFETESVDSVVGTLYVTGDVYVCGAISGQDNLVIDGEIRTISEENFEKFVSGAYTVNLDANGGSLGQTSVSVAFGQTYGTLPEPSREHYKFAGWYTQADGGDLVTADMTYEGLNDITLYAHWTLNTFKVSLDAAGGQVSQTSMDVTYGEKIGELPTPTRDYYSFDGWYTEASGGTRYTADTVFENVGDIVLYAHWTLKPISGWVQASSVPSGAQTVNQKWSYTQKSYTESTNTSLSGWVCYDSYWVWSGSGSAYYADIPSGFDNSYTNFSNGCPYSGYETTTYLRQVSTSWAGYAYWHWMYAMGANTQYDTNVYGLKRMFSLYRAYGDFNYTVFNYALSTVDCPYASGKGYCYGDSTCVGWDCYSIFDSWRVNDGQRRFYRFDYYLASYNDYYKMFKYYKEDSRESSSQPSASDTVYNIVEWVQYRAK